MPKNGTLVCLRGEQEKFVRETATKWDMPISTTARLLFESARKHYEERKTTPEPSEILAEGVV